MRLSSAMQMKSASEKGQAMVEFMLSLVIVMFFITPVAAIGLLLFGKYALSGEYNE